MPRLPEKIFFEEAELLKINAATARRMAVLRHLKMGSDQGAKSRFAQWLGVEVRRWNNYEHGWPVPRLVGHRLCQKFPGLTLDWLFMGRTDSLSVRLLEELEAAEAGCFIAADGSRHSPSPAGTKKRSTTSRA